jgi:hypothetical protein
MTFSVARIIAAPAVTRTGNQQAVYSILVTRAGFATVKIACPVTVSHSLDAATFSRTWVSTRRRIGSTSTAARHVKSTRKHFWALNQTGKEIGRSVPNEWTSRTTLAWPRRVKRSLTWLPRAIPGREPLHHHLFLSLTRAMKMTRNDLAVPGSLQGAQHPEC